MKVVILAGGVGSRLQEETSSMPKPMVQIGEKPILWHIMKIYSSFGFNEFLVALGYKSEFIKRYFLDYHYFGRDLTVHTKNGKAVVHGQPPEDWKVHLIDTGYKTQTGGRIKRLKEWIGNDTFLMTYGDGVSNVDIEKLIRFHKKHGKLATVTAVRPEARFGGLDLENQTVTKFFEKSRLREGWINGGFFVLEPEVLDYIAGDHMPFEQDPIEKLVSKRQLMAYLHDGFWQPMDTLRDMKLLNELWAQNQAPWKLW
ncbi:MAG: glucose-1-phosphate cytidylyltransferase [Candidatus Omnitrophica bacterium]|nr:glucose-1-phosphate cytidylyltransferase [Candidatus Omnitrophota bacterium]